MNLYTKCKLSSGFYLFLKISKQITIGGGETIACLHRSQILGVGWPVLRQISLFAGARYFSSFIYFLSSNERVTDDSWILCLQDIKSSLQWGNYLQNALSAPVMLFQQFFRGANLLFAFFAMVIKLCFNPCSCIFVTGQ